MMTRYHFRSAIDHKKALLFVIACAVMVGFMFLWKLKFFLAGLLLCGLIVLFYLKPNTVLPSIYSVILIFGTDMSIFQIGSANINIVDLFLILSLVVMLPRVFPRLFSLFKDNIMFKGIIILLFIGIINGLFLNNPFGLIRNDVHEMLYIPIVYLLVLLTMQQEKDIRLLTNTIIFSTAIASLKAIYIAISGQTFSSDASSANLWQAYSSVDPQIQGQRVILWGADTFFAITPLLMLGFFLYSVRRRLVIYYVPFISIIVGLFLSYTRTHLFGLLFAMATIAILVKAQPDKLKHYFSKTILVFAFLVPIVIIANMRVGSSSYTLKETFSNRFHINVTNPMESGSISYRIQESKAVLSEIKDYVLFGKGFGGEYYFKGFLNESKSLWTHNGYIWILLKTGVVGLTIFSLVVIVLFKRGIQKTRASADIEMKAIIVGYLGGLYVLLIMAITINRIASLEGCIYIGTCMGLVELIRKMHSHSAEPLKEGQEGQLGKRY